MSQENVEIARRWAEFFSRGEIETGLERCIDPNVDWRPITAALEGTTYLGHEGVRQWVNDLREDWEVFEATAQEFRDLGNRVLVLGTWTARGRGSGVELQSQPAAWLFDFRAGKVTPLETFTDRVKALEAAGLSE